MRVSFQAWFYTLLDQDLNAINHTAGKDLWRASTQMCPFKHLLTSQLWTNQSPTGWSTGDGKSHLHRDVKTHSTTTEKSIIKHYRQRLKVFLHPSCYSCTPGKLLPWRAKGQAKETCHVQGSPCAHARNTKIYTTQWDWRPTRTIRHLATGLPHLLSFVNILPSSDQ